MSSSIQVLEDTLKIFERGAYEKNGRVIPLKLTQAEREHSQVFLPDQLDEIRDARIKYTFGQEPCGYSCENKDSFSLARERYQRSPQLFQGEGKQEILVLNLANPVNPGGGVRRGARAQEEDLCRKSSLLLALESEAARPYYEFNRRLQSYMGSDAIIITPQVEIIKDDNHQLLDESVVVAVMTCAAPMVTCGLEGLTQQRYEELLYHRIEGMLKCAAYLNYKSLVLGAFGCGAFGNDARLVSDIFYKALTQFDFCGMMEKYMFHSIDFAVLDRTPEQYNYKEFCRNFEDFRRDNKKSE